MHLITDNETVLKRCSDLGLNVELSTLSLCTKNDIVVLMPFSKRPNVNAKVLILSTKPSFEEGVVLLQQDVQGYGNLYMQKNHLLQALATIENGAIWIYPEMMHELILLGSNATVKNEDVLKSLSVRERDVAREIEKGESNKEIAMALGITERTVKAHLSSIYEKLEVNDRLSLAMLLRK